MATGQPVPARGKVYLVQLDPTQGSEIRKTRPCLVISPDELNDHLRTVIVAPMTTGGKLIRGESSVGFKGRVDLLPRTNFVRLTLSD